MNNFNKKWMPFKINDLFSFQKGRRLTKTDMIDGSVNYIGAISDNNGIRQKIDIEPIFEPNCITVNYNGSVGEAFYQRAPFWASDDVNVLYARSWWVLNEKIGLFMATIIKANKYKFGYGRKWTLDKMKSSELMLPVNEYDLPDFMFMESVIEKIGLNPLSTNITSSNIPLYAVKWLPFNMADIFDFNRGTRLTKEDREKGDIPLVTAGYDNQGVAQFIAPTNSMQLFSDILTIDMFGNCFYHDHPCFCDDNIIILKSRVIISKYTALFLSAIINKDKYRYAYGRQYRQKNLLKHTIKLPAITTKEPDFQFMENYIKSLPCSDKI